MNTYNMRSRAGNLVANQYITTGARVIIGGNGPHLGTLFQSYKTVIAFKSDTGQVFLDEASWDCSTTTGRYRSDFLNEGFAETRAKIASGEYILTNLQNV